ncbi:MAG: hypothetical protein JO258_18735 [Alphaproteobacteria bacterium]|nr:hypothetical protein [Alphaproteobacteria bacterium]
MTAYLLLFAVVLGNNLLPAFGPPTWSIIVLFGINSAMPIWAIVPIAAVAAALGRFGLAHATRWARRWVSKKTRANLEAVGNAVKKNRGRGIAALAVFAFSPLPSAQLFEAAGLTGVRLLPFTAAFFAGRLVSYSIYAAGAKAAQHSSLADTFRHALTSPIGIGLQVLMLAGLVALAKVDWAKLLKER